LDQEDKNKLKQKNNEDKSLGNELPSGRSIKGEGESDSGQELASTDPNQFTKTQLEKYFSNDNFNNSNLSVSTIDTDSKSVKSDSTVPIPTSLLDKKVATS